MQVAKFFQPANAKKTWNILVRQSRPSGQDGRKTELGQ